MAVSIRDHEREGVGLTDAAKAALMAYALLVLHVPQVQYVYGYFDDGWLIAVSVGANVPLKDRHLVYAAQREIEGQYPDIDWGFRFIDEGSMPHTVPWFEPGESILINRSANN